MNIKRFIAKGFFLIFSFLVLLTHSASAQCAMCRATLESNVSDGTFLLTSENLNTGIMYLFITPYVLIGAIALVWYYNARKNARAVNNRSYSKS